MNTKEYKKQLKKVIDENPEGFTINAKTLKPINKGYAVAFTNRTNDNFKGFDDNFKDLYNQMNNNFNNMDNLFIGGWKNNNKTYLDLSVVENNKNKALNLMNTFNQKAIFNLNNNTEIINNKFREVTTN
jgi:hypothetical protein